MDASEHQDGDGREDDEDDDGCHDDDSQCGHAVVRHLVSCVRGETFTTCDFSSDYWVIISEQRLIKV